MVNADKSNEIQAYLLYRQLSGFESPFIPPNQIQNLAERISVILKGTMWSNSIFEMIGIFGYGQVSSYDNNLGQIIPNNIKLKIAERKYVNLASLINILQYT